MSKQSIPYILGIFVLALGVYFAVIMYEKKVTFPPDAKFYTLKFDNGVSLKAEVSDTREKTEKGLMFREKLDKNTGMIFIFGMEFKYSFWMKNTLVPLDIIWVNENWEVVYVLKEVPPCTTSRCPSYTPEYPAKYVIEAPGKWTVWNKIYPGMKITAYREDGARL